MPKDRQKWIDNAKGIAILLVIIGHVSGGLSGISFQFVYGIHLTMFFLLSGYTLKAKALTREYVSIKFRRLMVPYFYTCFAILITDVINCLVLFHDASIQTVTKTIGNDLVRSFFASGAVTSFGPVEFGTRIGAVWFLPALFFAIICFQFLLQKTQNASILGISTAAIALAGIISGRFLWFPFSLQSGMMASFFLWIGYEIKRRNVLTRIKWYHYVTAQIILLFGIHFGYCSIGFVSAQINDMLISIPVGLAGCLLIYLLSTINRKGIILSYIGRISLKVLCVHLYALETMGPYFERVLNRFELTGNAREWSFIGIEILFACLIAICMDKSTIFLSKRQEKTVSSFRDPGSINSAVNIEKGIMVLFMLSACYSIDGRLRSIICSFYLPAFVLFSGYNYHDDSPRNDRVKKLFKSYLIPYTVFIAVRFIINASNRNWSYLRDCILGMSSTGKLFRNCEPVGLIHILLVLFVCELLYSALDKLITDRKKLTVAIAVMSVFGLLLGQKQYWMPWNFDIACYALPFFHIGRLCKEAGFLSHLRKLNYSYFLIAPVWAFLVYNGSMDVAIRNYGNYGIGILGSLAAVWVMFLCSSYISDKLTVLSVVLNNLGEAVLPVILVHTLFSPYIEKLLSCWFNSNYSPFMICSIGVELLLSFALKRLFDAITKQLAF